MLQESTNCSVHTSLMRRAMCRQSDPPPASDTRASSSLAAASARAAS